MVAHVDGNDCRGKQMVYYVDKQSLAVTLAHFMALAASGIGSKLPEPADHSWNVRKFAETTRAEHWRGPR